MNYYNNTYELSQIMYNAVMQVTEFDWNANKDVDMGDHTLHAEQIHNFYTLMFSLEVFLDNVTIA